MGTESGPTHETSHEHRIALPKAFMLFWRVYIVGEIKDVSEDGI